MHVVIGYGPAGKATARLLASQGQQVRVITRTARPAESGIEHVTGVSAENTGDATVIYDCSGLPYPRWAHDFPPLAASVLQAARDAGAVLVILSNLYGYGPVDTPITEDLPLQATTVKGRVRADIWQRASGYEKAVEARASDFYGPEIVEGGHLAGRAIPQLLRGKPVQLLGDPSLPHSWTYVPDVAEALVRLGATESAWGQAWHVPTLPALSAHAMLDALADHGDLPRIPVRQLSPFLIRTMGLASPLLRELQEIRYQFDRPFAVDSSRFTTEFGVEPTPLDQQLAATLSWWRAR
ncbi:NAD-dependent epimerase/dehydratase family protein [Pseudonocardiaceae bacterium YIM PH 21723]|nr:NAD-dependent epimerase/dehydratase family protein [Pseudonocardiaceae bacterium YIM PH 21723]